MVLAKLMLAAVVNGGFENGELETFPGWWRGKGETAAAFRGVAGAGLNGNRGLSWSVRWSDPRSGEAAA